MDLIPIPSVSEFRFVSLIPKTALTAEQQAVAELFHCADGVWAILPIGLRDFLLRFAKSCGLPLDCEELPFWAHKAAHHVCTICYSTLRKTDFKNPTTNDFGRFAGHLWAMIQHAKERSAIFEKFPGPTTELFREFFIKIEAPVQRLIEEGMRKPPAESKKFVRGMAFAYERTFDQFGLPKGWNTSSRVYLGVCMCWRLLSTHVLSFPKFHKWLETTFGKQEIGTEERVKKLTDRMGFKFEPEPKTKELCQGTIEISAVRGEPQTISDK